MSNKILIIDDSESIREVVAFNLSNAGYNVVTGVNGNDGWNLLQNTKGINLVITDLNMPVMDGIAFLKKVRETDQFKYLPIIILTTESQENKKTEARLAGATGWIIKPFVKEKLIEVVKKIIR